MEEGERRRDPDAPEDDRDLDRKGPSVPPSEEGMPSEADADETLPGVPDEAEQRLERGDE
jgi:hypothetical protein